MWCLLLHPALHFPLFPLNQSPVTIGLIFWVYRTRISSTEHCVKSHEKHMKRHIERSWELNNGSNSQYYADNVYKRVEPFSKHSNDTTLISLIEMFYTFYPNIRPFKTKFIMFMFNANATERNEQFAILYNVFSLFPIFQQSLIRFNQPFIRPIFFRFRHV